MQTNLKAGFKRRVKKDRGGGQRWDILPPTGLAQNAAMVSFYADFTRYCWTCLWSHLSSKGPIRARAALSASFSEREQFKMFCRLDKRRSWKVQYVIGIYFQDKIVEIYFFTGNVESMLLLRPENMFWESGKYVQSTQNWAPMNVWTMSIWHPHKKGALGKTSEKLASV